MPAKLLMIVSISAGRTLMPPGKSLHSVTVASKRNFAVGDIGVGHAVHDTPFCFGLSLR
jgi:hypothetical protein